MWSLEVGAWKIEPRIGSLHIWEFTFANLVHMLGTQKVKPRSGCLKFGPTNGNLKLGALIWEPAVGSLQLKACNWELAIGSLPTVGGLKLGAYEWELEETTKFG